MRVKKEMEKKVTSTVVCMLVQNMYMCRKMNLEQEQ